MYSLYTRFLNFLGPVFDIYFCYAKLIVIFRIRTFIFKHVGSMSFVSAIYIIFFFMFRTFLCWELEIKQLLSSLLWRLLVSSLLWHMHYKKNSVCGHLFQVLVLPCPCKKSMNDVFGAKCFLSGSESDTFHVLLWICNNFYQTGLWLQHNFYYMSSTFNLTWLCLYKTND